jgi:chromosome segregation ATPase
VIPEGHLEEMTSPIEGELNYDELAAALLSKVVEAISNGSVGGRGDSTRTRRQLERLQRQNQELATELSKARMELKESATEREDLRERLQNSEGNLALLTDRLVEKPGKAVASSKLSKLKAEDRALLDHLLSGDEVRSNRAT